MEPSIFNCCNTQTKVTNPNLSIVIAKGNPATKSRIMVGNINLEGVLSCDVHLDAETELLTATLKVIIKDINTV